VAWFKNFFPYFALCFDLTKIKNHNVKRLLSILVFICLTSFTYTYAGGSTSAQGTAVHTLVIDPGHGGLDPGAIGPGGHHESDLALAVSLKFGEMVKQAFPDVKVIYTRTTDKFVSLADRADTANKVKADLFICIHLNSATNHDARGTSTYVLGLHRTDDNLEVAKRENAVIELEGDKDKNYEFDPNSPEGHIIMSMKQNAFLDQSILIAYKIEDQLAALAKRQSRGVKQAGFWVLYKTAMPSLLAEIGFISNPTEEQYLASDEGQTNIATSIFKAFSSYKNEIEGKKDTTALPITVQRPDTIKPVIHADITPPGTATTVIGADTQPKRITAPLDKPAPAPTQARTKETLYFTVQVFAATRKPTNYDELMNTFGTIETEVRSDGIIRFMTGQYATFGEAKKTLEKARRMGISDAFIVAYLNKARQDGGSTLELGQKHP
jgi:N-acetylmuramoyl-L-alanine amidase